MKILVDEGKKPNFGDWVNISEFEWNCLYLWSKAPKIPNNTPNMGINPLFGIDLTKELDTQGSIPRVRRGKYSRCPYCITDEKCHFESESCAYSSSTSLLDICFILLEISNFFYK